jgi:iron complex outermembrane recepter protein
MSKYKLFIAAVTFLLMAGSIHAQLVYMATDTTGVPEVFLDEITVRAPKEKPTSREIPGSVSVITSSTIHEAGISNVKDATSFIPNFFMPDYGSKLTSPVYIRGIGARINEPSVGMYVDNAPFFDKAAFDFDLFDIERIEVLRGPQGTLYGRNTMGGTLNVITRSPMNFTGTRFMATAGSHGQYGVRVSHFARPLSSLGYSLSVNYRHRDGFFTNQFNDEKVDHLNSVGFRNRLIWRVNDKLTAGNTFGFEISKQGGYPYAIMDEDNPGNGDINYNHPSGYDRDLFTNALAFNYKSNLVEVIATTSFQYLDDFQDIDQDFTADSLFLATQNQKQHLISQEVVAKSRTKGRYEWLFGAFGFYQDFDRNVSVSNQPVNANIFRDFTEIKQGFAFFHQSTINDFLVTNLSLILGLRFDLENNRLSFRNEMVVNEQPVSFTDTLFPSMEFSVLSPKLALNYYLSESSSVYALVSKGYKTGGFNAIFERDEDLMFDPEESWNYEAGFKSSFGQNRIHADAAVFYIDWTNQQIYQTVPSGQGQMLKNTGHSVSKGFELSTRASVVPNFEIGASYGYTHATFVSHAINDSVNYDGNFIPYVPRHTLSMQVNKTLLLPDNQLADMLRVTAIYRALGKHYWNEANTRAESSYGIVDLRLMIQRKNLGLELWARNLFQQEYAAFYFEALGNGYYQPGKPFNFGVNLSLSL